MYLTPLDVGVLVLGILLIAAAIALGVIRSRRSTPQETRLLLASGVCLSLGAIVTVVTMVSVLTKPIGF